MALQRPPPSPHPSDDRQRTPPLSPSTPDSSQPSLSSTSTSESSLSTPFEQLALDDRTTRPLSPSAQKQHTEHAHGAAARADVIHTDQDSGGEMFERMQQDADRMQSRRSTPGSPALRTHALPHLSHSHFTSRSPGPLSADRPPLPHRNTSFSKRHASFDSPREVPLPSLPSRSPTASMATSSSRTGPESDHREYSSQVDAIPAHSSSSSDSRADGGVSSPSEASMSPYRSIMGQQQVNAPVSHYMDTSEDGASVTSTIAGPASAHQLHINRNVSGPVHPFARPFSSGEPPRSIHSPTPVRPGQLPDRSSTASLPLPMNTPYHTLPTVHADPGSIPESEPTPAPPSMSSVAPSASFPGGGPVDVETSRVESLPSLARRSSSRSLLPSRPPDWLRGNSEPLHAAASTSRPAAEPLIMPPAMPTVLMSPPPPSQDNAQTVHRRFLSQAPPPQDSYLAIETGAREYTLIARLPGFRRDAITLSTRRRRILHIVADSWEPNGGHFERRISFGYDADLTQVRAEFDGDMLRITVPRRPMPITYWGTRA